MAGEKGQGPDHTALIGHSKEVSPTLDSPRGLLIPCPDHHVTTALLPVLPLKQAS